MVVGSDDSPNIPNKCTLNQFCDYGGNGKHARL